MEKRFPFFLLDQVIMCSHIPDRAFKDLSDKAYQGLEDRIRTRDEALVSLKHEYRMDMPLIFEEWLAETIHAMYLLHREDHGIYGLTEKNLRIKSIWVNKMEKGDQHFPHQHLNSFYSFAAYIKASDNDAQFMFIKNDNGEVVNVNKDSEQHILIFPSTLIHTVYPKTTDGERISVSGNVVINT